MGHVPGGGTDGKGEMNLPLDPKSETLAGLLARGGLVKICGLREPRHAEAAVVAGADLLGFIFAPARRRVTPDTARACIETARSAASRPFVAVGVFVDEEPGRIAEIARAAGLDAVQLNGGEPPGFVESLPLPAIVAFKPRPEQDEDDLAAAIAACLSPVGGAAAALVDGYLPGSAGGAGVVTDWDLAARLARRTPLLLAGGLDPDNVDAAIRRVRPLGVDVSTGVERDGVKDSGRIAAFVAAAKAAFAETPSAVPGKRQRLGP